MAYMCNSTRNLAEYIVIHYAMASIQ